MLLNKFLFTLIFLSFYLTGISQSRYDVERRHSIDPIVTYYRGITAVEKQTNIENPLEESFRNLNVSDFIRLGVKYNYLLTPKIIIATGLIYFDPLTYQRKITVKSNQTKRLIVNRRKSYIEMPFTLRYIYTRNWCKSFIEISPMIQYLLIDGNNRKFHKAGNFAIGAEFNLGHRVTNFVQLNGYYQFANINQGLFNYQHYGMGISFGARFHI